MELNKVYQGDCLEVLKTFEDESVDCVVTSPPYFAVRDYGTENQIGLEDHPQKYINKIVEVMRECKRVLKPQGTIWLNLGDSYYTKSGSGQGNNFLDRHKQLSEGRDVLNKAHTQIRGKFKSNWLQSKQRLLIPHRIAIAMQDELGLICRNDITWVKQLINWKTKESVGSSMPTSAQDRLNNNSENIFFFVKNNKYYFDLDAIRVPHKEVSLGRIKSPWNGHKEKMSSYENMKIEKMCNPNGKNPGDCVRFPFEPTQEEHYAVFPKTLPNLCIKAGCPEGGVVLDPFAGSGTTLYVAKHLLRVFVGIELNEKYVELINKKLSQCVVDDFLTEEQPPMVDTQLSKFEGFS